MKFIKTGFVVGLFLFCTLQSKASAIVTSLTSCEYDIEQSPLSDDETNPVSANTTDIAEFDFEDSDENNFTCANYKIDTLSHQNYNLQSFISPGITNAYKQHLRFSILNSPQSYLQVFRI